MLASGACGTAEKNPPESATEDTGATTSTGGGGVTGVVTTNGADAGSTSTSSAATNTDSAMTAGGTGAGVTGGTTGTTTSTSSGGGAGGAESTATSSTSRGGPDDGATYFACVGSGGMIQVLLSKPDESAGSCVRVLFTRDNIEPIIPGTIETSTDVTPYWASRSNDVSDCDATSDDWTIGSTATSMSGTVAYTDENHDPENSYFWPATGLDIHLVLEFDTDEGTVDVSIDVVGCAPSICTDGVDCRTGQ